MNQELLIIDDKIDSISVKKSNILINCKIKKFQRHNFDIKYDKLVKNFIITFNFNSKMEPNDRELVFYYRYLDDKNYCYFSIKEGQYIKLSVIGNGINKLQTSYLKITDQNLFNDKFSFVLSVFEDTTTVLIDKKIVLNIDHTPNLEGDLGIQMVSNQEYQPYNLARDNFNITEDVINFQYIIELPRQSDVFFMHANDFYEQNRYDYALYYYNKGLLFGAGDDKIYNRIANLYFLIEEYENAVKFYSLALKHLPNKIEYQINLGRALVRNDNENEALPYLEKAIESVKNDIDLLIDYSSVWIKKKDYNKAITFLKQALEIDKDNFSALYKLGKCLIESGVLNDGKDELYKAAKSVMSKDPSSSANILKYSIDKKADLKSVKLLSKILYNNREFREAYELIKKCRVEIEYDEELFEILINTEIELELSIQVVREFDGYQKPLSDNLKLLKSKALLAINDVVNAGKIIEDLLIVKPEKLIYKIISTKLQILSKTKSNKDADNLVKLALKGKPDYDSVMEEYAKILVDRNNYEEAIAILLPIFEKVNNQNKNEKAFELMYNLGIAYLGISNYFEAVKYFFKIYDSYKEPQLIFLLSTALFHLKRFKDALDILFTHQSILPKDGSVENLLGNIYLGLENIPEAQKYYYKALEVDDQNEEFALNLAESFYKLNDYYSAYKITKQIVKENSLDRAKSLHLRIKSHLFNSIYCSVCNREWDIPKNTTDSILDTEMLDKLPKDAPAGYCKKCNKYFCRNCVDGIPNVYTLCHYCKTILDYDIPGIKIAAEQSMREQYD